MPSPSSHPIWLVSPYHAGSHAAWAAGLAANSRHRLTLLTLEGRFWKWRMLGSAAALAQQARAQLEQETPAAVITTDMLNLPAWLSLLRRDLPPHIPVLLYMHENQLTYPWRPGEGRDLTFATINWLSQLSADAVIFNSAYHRDVWFAELPNLLKHFPDYQHLDLIDAVRSRACVLSPGIATAELAPETGLDWRPASQPPLILWNQRWEHDKRPAEFFDLLYRLADAGAAFRLAVAGENFRNAPEEFAAARERLAGRIEHWGFVSSRAAYVDLLRRADLVISTAAHEFFGIAVLEAIAAGAFPLLPRRLSYPELIPPVWHAACLYADADDLLVRALAYLRSPVRADPELRRHVVAHYAWPPVAAAYDDLVERIIGGGSKVDWG